MQQIVEVVYGFQIGIKLLGETAEIIRYVVVEHQVADLFPAVRFRQVFAELVEERFPDIAYSFCIHMMKQMPLGLKPFVRL